MRADFSPRGGVAHLDDPDDVVGIFRILESGGHWVSLEEVRHEMEETGLRRIEGFDVLQTQAADVCCS